MFSDSVPFLPSRLTFKDLEQNYLSQALPVTFSYKPPKNFSDFSQFYNQNNDFNPCDLRTNLIFNRKSTTVKHLIKRTTNNSSYYFHFRNCDAKSLKSSRLIDGRPEFFASSLPPAYSSWILRSRNYTSSRYLPLVLDGLIFLRQLKGTTEFKLTSREECQGICENELKLQLNEGEGLLFTTDLYDLSYSPNSATGGDSASFLTETEWK